MIVRVFLTLPKAKIDLEDLLCFRTCICASLSRAKMSYFCAHKIILCVIVSILLHIFHSFNFNNNLRAKYDFPINTAIYTEINCPPVSNKVTVCHIIEPSRLVDVYDGWGKEAEK